MSAAAAGRDAAVKALLAAGANASVADGDGTTALMAAASRGRLESVQGLIKAKAIVDQANSDGHTALFFAHNGRAQVEALAARYAETVGARALDTDLEALAEARKTHGAILDALLKAGADPKKKDLENRIAEDFDYRDPNKPAEK